MTWNNPTDRSKLGKAKRHILTDKKGIPLSVVISSVSTHDIKLVTNVVYNAVIKRPPVYKTKKTGRRKRRKLQHLCLDKAYNSEPEEQELIKRGYVAYSSKEKKRCKRRTRGQDYITTLVKSEKAFCKKMGCRENQLVVQQIQETVHQIWEEGRELSWIGTVILLYDYLQKDNFGIGSKSI
jgi:hypothetical protein